MQFPNPPAYAKYLCTISNSCGASSLYVTFRNSNTSYPYNLIVSYSSMDEMAVVKLDEDSSQKSSPFLKQSKMLGKGTHEIQLWNVSSMLRRFKTDQWEYRISLSGFPPGIYFVRVIKDNKTYTKKLIKN